MATQTARTRKTATTAQAKAKKEEQMQAEIQQSTSEQNTSNTDSIIDELLRSPEAKEKLVKLLFSDSSKKRRRGFYYMRGGRGERLSSPARRKRKVRVVFRIWSTDRSNRKGFSKRFARHVHSSYAGYEAVYCRRRAERRRKKKSTTYFTQTERY